MKACYQGVVFTTVQVSSKDIFAVRVQTYCHFFITSLVHQQAVLHLGNQNNLDMNK